jgi:hypothetical protein
MESGACVHEHEVDNTAMGEFKMYDIERLLTRQLPGQTATVQNMSL